MTVTSRNQYDVAMQALAACVMANVPALLFGDPGTGKTSMVESARHGGWSVETVIISQSDPTDLNGLPVVSDGDVKLMPPAWAKRLAHLTGPGVLFMDELNLAPPSVQAAALRLLTHREIGDLKLPPDVSIIAAANRTELSAGGWDLSAPTASRFVHLDWGMPFDVFSEGLATNNWPRLPVQEVPAGFNARHTLERVLVSGFLQVRSGILSAIPNNASDRGGAFPTPRGWTYAARVAAVAHAMGWGEDVRAVLIAGCVGAPAAHEYLRWVEAQDLLDPEHLLSVPELADFSDMRPDRIYVTLQAVLAAVAAETTPERWRSAVDICAFAAKQSGIDPAVPVVRALMRPGTKPDGVPAPASIKVFAPALMMAGLLTKAGES